MDTTLNNIVLDDNGVLALHLTNLSSKSVDYLFTPFKVPLDEQKFFILM